MSSAVASPSTLLVESPPVAPAALPSVLDLNAVGPLTDEVFLRLGPDDGIEGAERLVHQ